MNAPARDSLRTLIKTVLFMLVVIIALFALPKIVSCVMPFFCAWVVSFIIKPTVKLFEKLHIGRKLAVMLSMLLVIAVIFGVLYGVSVAVVREINDIAELFSQTRDGVPVFVWDIIEVLPGGISRGAAGIMKSLFSGSSNLMSSAFKSFLPRIGGFAGKLPGALVFTVVFVMAVFFMSNDPDGLKRELRRIIPPDKYKYLHTIKQSFSKACGGYIRAQLIIMSIVFCILLVGFLLLGVRFALLLALAISVIDAIPVLGTGVILNPWAVICLLQGNYVTAAGLVGLYVIILITRQFIEPRILSGQLGIHPLLTLVSMYAGLKLIGIFGMILGPLVALVIVNFIKINREMTEDKEELKYGA